MVCIFISSYASECDLRLNLCKIIPSHSIDQMP